MDPVSAGLTIGASLMMVIAKALETGDDETLDKVHDLLPEKDQLDLARIRAEVEVRKKFDAQIDGEEA